MKGLRTEALMRLFTVRVMGCVLALFSLCALSYADEQTGSLKNKQGEFAVARKALRHAAEIAVRIKEPIGKVHVLSWIAVSQAKVEDVQGALKTAAKIGDPRTTVLATADIASVQAKLGQERAAAKIFQQAHVLAASLKDSYDRAYAFGKIAELETKSQNADAANTFAQAIQIANTLPKDHEKASVLFWIGASQLDSGDVRAAATFRESSRFLSTVQDDFRKWMTAHQLAPMQVRAGDDQGALATANYFTDQKEISFKSTMLSAVAIAQAQHGNIEEALKTYSDIQDEKEKEGTLRWIVQAQLQKGNVQEAIRLTETIQKDSFTKTLALLSIAKAQGKASDSAEAAERVAQAVDLFRKGALDPPGFQWVPVIQAIIETGQLKHAAEAAAVIKPPTLKAQSLAMVAEAYAKAGDRGSAEGLCEQALESELDGNSMSQIAVAYAQIGDVGTALKTASKIPGESDRSRALQRIADIQTQNGHAREALKWAESLKSPELKSAALLGVALGVLQKYGIDPSTSV